jgi:hypothetical protein
MSIEQEVTAGVRWIRSNNRGFDKTYRTDGPENLRVFLAFLDAGAETLQRNQLGHLHNDAVGLERKLDPGWIGAHPVDPPAIRVASALGIVADLRPGLA